MKGYENNMRCEICGELIGLFGWRGVKLKTGEAVCEPCLSHAGIHDFQNSQLYSREEFFKYYSEHENLYKIFNPTPIGGSNSLRIDYENKLFGLQYFDVQGFITKNDNIFRFEDLVGYDVRENCSSVFKGGVGSAIAGGILLGDAGFIAGSSNKKQKNVCESLEIVLQLRNCHTNAAYIRYISSSIKTNSNPYRKALSYMDSHASALQQIIDENNREQATSSFSIADELNKLGELLKNKLISQDEFEKLKNKLL